MSLVWIVRIYEILPVDLPANDSLSSCVYQDRNEYKQSLHKLSEISADSSCPYNHDDQLNQIGSGNDIDKIASPPR